MKKDILVSIIIPVYNIKNYLNECVESVINQSYKNIEIIIVDDGSSDGSNKICDFFKQKDNRIKVFHKKNGGLSDARNYGMNRCSGEYICFIDGDDAIPQKYVENLLIPAVNNNADMAITDAIVFESSRRKIDYGTEPICEIWGSEECMKEMLIANKCGHSAWGKLYKKEIWNDIKFPEGKLYEDYLTLYRVVAKCNKIIFLSTPMYYYRKRGDSIMNSRVSEKKLSIVEISEDVTKYICEYSEDLITYAVYRQTVILLKTMDEIISLGLNNYSKYQEMIMAIMYRNKQKFLEYNKARKIDVIKFKALLINKVLFKIIYKIGNLCNYIKLKLYRVIKMA